MNSTAIRLSKRSSWIGTRTTKIFCRPSCPAKTPLDKNMVYFTSFAEASAAGFRPCLRCRPTPSERNPAAAPILTRAVPSPLGRILLGATERGICLLDFADRRALASELVTIQKRFGRRIATGSNEHIERMSEELRRYFQGKLRRFSTPLEFSGTPFEMAAWRELLNIPYGKTVSYGDVAKRIGRPGAQRAVGRANGANLIAIAVPCHRVIDSNGKLHGYAGGLWRKRRLLALESRGENNDKQ